MRKPPTVFLHVGAMKTGTTYLQKLWELNKVSLDRCGVLFPGESWRDQVLATRDVLERHGNDPKIQAETAGMWDRLVDEIVFYDGTIAIFSHEFLSFASTGQARRVLSSFLQHGADVHVLLTVRDASRTLPGQWQSDCRSGGRTPWPIFAQSATTLMQDGEFPSGKGARLFQRTQDVLRIVDTWQPLLDEGRLHVTSVPSVSTNADGLWPRVSGLMGIDGSACPSEPKFTNPSLGHASAELLRRLNMELGDVAMSDYNRVVRQHLGLRVLSKRAAYEAPVRLDRATAGFTANWNHAMLRGLHARGLPTHGDLAEDLPSDEASVRAQILSESLSNPPVKPVLDAAVNAYEGLQGLPGVPTGLEAPRRKWATESRPVVTAVRDIATLVRSAI